MLLQLNIKNFTLIESLTINFENGFNVLSGETGAGKSILIDAINYVLGGKFSKDSIRTGQDKTYVEAVFTIQNSNTKSLLDQFGIDSEDIVIISRESFLSGKSIAKINGKSLILSNIKQIGQTLLDIHGQHENQALLDSANHISYLDYFAQSKIHDTFEEYKLNYKKIKAIESKILELEGQGTDREKLIDFLEYQIREIEDAKLKIDEDKELESEYTLLSNSEKINNVLASCYTLIYEGSEGIASVYDSINLVIKDLRNIEKHMHEIQKIADNLEESYYNIEQNIHDIREIKDNLVFDDTRLETINARIYLISSLKKKYGKNIEDILNYNIKIKNQYDELINSSELIMKLKMEKQCILDKMKILAREIHDIRTEISRELELRIKNELNYIGLEKSSFKISVILEEEFYENGSDTVQFLISTNPGEPERPLEKIVSGGELSRIMLAIKTVFVDKDKIPTVIFDEIDTGISGRIAQSVGEKMYLVSRSHQVFCVTHLPQIACISDAHYLVSKQTTENKTFTVVEKMSLEEKEYEIARMISGSSVTKLALDNSKELIKIADNKKINLQ